MLLIPESLSNIGATLGAHITSLTTESLHKVQLKQKYQPALLRIYEEQYEQQVLTKVNKHLTQTKSLDPAALTAASAWLAQLTKD